MNLLFAIKTIEFILSIKKWLKFEISVFFFAEKWSLRPNDGHVQRILNSSRDIWMPFYYLTLSQQI